MMIFENHMFMGGSTTQKELSAFLSGQHAETLLVIFEKVDSQATSYDYQMEELSLHKTINNESVLDVYILPLENYDLGRGKAWDPNNHVLFEF